MLEALFSAVTGSLTTDAARCGLLWTDITARHSGASRHYHNMHHLDALSAELLTVKAQISDWEVTILSVAYHDIVYNTFKSDNEEASAAYARQALSGLLPYPRLAACEDMILATKAHEESSIGDTNYFTDADLSILGAAPERYREYTAQIRKEYRQYPSLIYKPGRKKVLQHFLAMPRIFKTAHFYERYEAAAKANMEEELRRLSA